MEQIGDDIGQVDGVEAVALTTPNRKADLGIVQVVPEHGQTDPRTAELVRDMRERAASIEDRYDVTDVLVTGQTAVTIDVSERLAGALLPFGLVVVGLSLLLLMLVFRSIAVPLKATVGYLFSVGASFGAVVLVFQEGWFADLFNVEQHGPGAVVPADHAHGRALRPRDGLRGLPRRPDARGVRPRRRRAPAPSRRGFVSSARVVTAAAVIMVAVFASFVPHGDSAVKPIAFGLAVGVLVDAFVVRMTLVPAVLALLGSGRGGCRRGSTGVSRPRRRGRGPLGPPRARRLDRASTVPSPCAPRASRSPTPPPGAAASTGLDLVVRARRGAPRHRRGDRAPRAPCRSAGRPDASRRGRLVVLGRFLPTETAAVRARVGIDDAPATPRPPDLCWT